MERRAHWVWRDRGLPFAAVNVFRPADPDPAQEANLFLYFRRRFELDSVPPSVPLRVSADGRYRLYANGAYLGRGPARCDPQFQYFDVHDIAGRLRPGENVLAVLVHSYGRDMSWYQLPRAHWSRVFGYGGLFVECDALPTLDTGPDWRYAVAEAWARETAGGAVGFAEVYDARKATGGWTRPEFDDSGWNGAVVLEAPGFTASPPIVPFPHMVQRDIPFLLEEPRDAERVLSVREVTAEGAPDPLSLAEAARTEPSTVSVANPEALLHGDGGALVRPAADTAASIVIDFGRDVTGYPRLELDGPAGATVDVSYSERLLEDGRVPVMRSNPLTSQNVHRYILREGAQSWEKFERAGFRYMQLTVSPSPERPEAPVLIRRANINFVSYPVGDRGRFACSDETLTRVWKAGAYTLQLCMQDGFEDCPSREQRQWVGDAYVESLVSYACFGDTQLTAKLLRQVAQSQRADGMTCMATPGDFAVQTPLYIADYCLLWIMTAAEHALHAGDRSIATELLPAIARALAWFERHTGRAGLLVDPPGWLFIDWAEVDRRGASGAVNALMVQALRAAAGFAEDEGMSGAAGRWRKLAAHTAASLNDRLWDEERGVYVDALLPDGRSRRVSQHTNAALIAAGIAPRERWDSMLDYVMDTERLVETGTGLMDRPAALDEERQVVLAQPFFSHFLHRALAAAGRQSQLLDNIRNRWGAMLPPEGTDTFWEHWHGRDSRCHAWSATPAYDLSREVLGVRPLLPGFERFRVEPHAAGLSWAEGVYPSVKGDIRVAWRLEDGVFRLEFEVPPGTGAEVVLPDEPRTVKSLGPGRHKIEAPLGGADA